MLIHCLDIFQKFCGKSLKLLTEVQHMDFSCILLETFGELLAKVSSKIDEVEITKSIILELLPHYLLK